MEEGNRRGRFLDVSEYVLKEFSPLTRAINSDFRSQERVSCYYKVYEYKWLNFMSLLL